MLHSVTPSCLQWFSHSLNKKKLGLKMQKCVFFLTNSYLYMKISSPKGLQACFLNEWMYLIKIRSAEGAAQVQAVFCQFLTWTVPMFALVHPCEGQVYKDLQNVFSCCQHQSKLVVCTDVNGQIVLDLYSAEVLFVLLCFQMWLIWIGGLVSCLVGAAYGERKAIVFLIIC